MTENLPNNSLKPAIFKVFYPNKLSQVLSPVETWGFGFTGLLFWLLTAPAIHSSLGVQAIFVWIPAALVGILINLQVKHMGNYWKDVSGGTPLYTARLFEQYPRFGRYAALSYLQGWTSIPPLCAIILTNLIADNFASIGITVPKLLLYIAFTAIAYIVAFSGIKSLSILHLFFIAPALGLLLLFMGQGIGWLAFSHLSPGLFPPNWGTFNLSSWAEFYFIIVFAAYGVESSAAFVADSLNPSITLKCLKFSAFLIIPVFVGCSWVLMRNSVPGTGEDLYLNIKAASLPFWGTGASFLATFLISCGCLLSCATAVSVSPRIIYQLSRDKQMSPLFSVVSRQNVLVPALILCLVNSFIYLLMDFNTALIISGTGYFFCIMCMHLGMWINKGKPYSRWPNLSLFIFITEALIFCAGGIALGMRNFILGLAFPALIMAFDYLLGKFKVGPASSDWWEKRRKQKYHNEKIEFQIIYLIIFLGSTFLFGWYLSSLFDGIRDKETDNNIIAIFIISVSFFGIAVGSWTILRYIFLVSEVGIFLQDSQITLESKVIERTEELIKRNSYVSMLEKIAVASNESREIYDAIYTCLREICDYTGWNIGHAFIKSEQDTSKIFSTGVWYKINIGDIALFKEKTQKLALLTNGMASKVFETGKAIWENDIKNQTNFLRKEYAEKLGIKSRYYFPIMIESEVVGVLEFFSINEKEPYEDLIETLNHTTSQLSRVFERKRAIFKIEQLSQRNQMILESVSEGIYGIDTEGNTTFINPAVSKITGWNLEDLLGKSMHSLLHHTKADGTKYPREECPIYQAYKDGNVYHVENEVFWKKDGTSFPVEYTSNPIRNENKIIVGAVITFRDITQKKKIEAEFLRTQRIESIGTLTSGIAHDLNNILAPIMMSIQLLGMDISETKRNNLLLTLEKAVQRGSDVVRQLLLFGRGVEGNKKTINLNNLIIEIEKMINESFPKSIVIENNISDLLWPVSGDSTQLHQVLLNLFVNARDAMPEGGRLIITAENFTVDEIFAGINPEAKAGSYVTIEISDNGTGMPPEIVDKIFEPFFTTKEPGKGTGLGLSTLIGIVKNHDGFVNVFSEVGKGTKFKVYIPALQTGEVENKEIQDWHLLRGNDELIMVVDDESSIREIVKNTLERFGYAVITAGNGLEAVEIYKTMKDKIKIVLTDINMPVMDGSTLIKTLIDINQDAKIIASSGLLKPQSINDLKNTQPIEFLQKPYKAENLLKKLDEVLKSIDNG